MNYPVWNVAFGAGLLIALVSILHVFVSHFAVGGGLFLVLTERRALRQGDQGAPSFGRPAGRGRGSSIGTLTRSSYFLAQK